MAWPWETDDSAQNKGESAGFLTDAFSNPWVSLPYSIASGLAAGATPGTARIAAAQEEGEKSPKARDLAN